MKTLTLPPLARLLGALAVSASLAACSGAANSAAPGASMPPAPVSAGTPPPAPVRAAAPVARAPSSLMQQLQAEIGDAACDNSAQCKTVAIGHKACGGPESYMPWSSKRSDAGKLARLAAELAAERKAQNVSSGMMSTCSLVMDPGAVCTAGRCVAGQGGINAPAVR